MNSMKFKLGNEGVSEVIGTVLLLAIALSAFSVLAIYVFSNTGTTSTPHVNLVGYMDEDHNAIIEHRGGDSLKLQNIRVIIWKGEEASHEFSFPKSILQNYNQSIFLGSNSMFYDMGNNKRWDVGDYIKIDCPTVFGNITHWQISVMVIDKASNSIIMSGILQQGILHTTPPVALFTYRPWDPKTGERVEFNANQSYDPDGGSIVTYRWDFGDGNIGYGVLVVHRYTNPGTYTVTLTVVDDEGESSTATAGYGYNVPPPVNVTENIPPTVNFTWDVDPDVDGTINFYSSATDPDGTIVSYFWNFGDGNTSSSPNPSHTYARSGTYTVTLIVTDDNGGQSSYELTVTVPNILPVAGFSYSPRNVTTARTVTFDGDTPYSYDKDGYIVNWSWDFDGNGIVDAYGSVVTHRYSSPGNYTVILNVTDNDGGWDVYQKNITVYTPAVASPPRFLIVDNTPIGWDSGIDNIIAACQAIMPDSEFSYGKAIDSWYFTNDEYTSPDLRGQRIDDTLINQFDIVIWSTGDFPGDGGNANWDGNDNTWSTPMTEGYDDTSDHVYELAEHLTGNVTAGTLLLCGTYAARDLQDYPGNGANEDEIWLGNTLGLREPTGGIHYDPDWVPFSGRLGEDYFRGKPYTIQGTLVGIANTSSGQISIATLNITAPMDAYTLYKQSDSLFKYSLQAGGGTSTETLLNEDMETNPGWTTGGSKDEWDWGICRGGPGVAHSGSRCYGTDMSGSDYRYNNNAHCYVRTGWIDLDGYTTATLEFYDWYILEDGYDFVYLQVYDDESWNWHTIATYTGSQQSWTHKTYDLSAYTGKSIRIRWLLDSDGAVRYDGYYLDDVKLTATKQGVPSGYYAIDAERGKNRSIILGFDLNSDAIDPESRTNYLRNVLAWLAEGAGYATEVWVNNDPPEGWLDDPTHVDSIQAGINAVPPGGRVYVIGTDGQVYEENVVVDKSVDLIGIDNPTIRIGGNYVVKIESDWVKMDGFTIEGNAAENGVYLEDAARCTIVNCTIRNVSKMGIYLSNSHNNTIQNNSIYNALYGIYGSWSLGNHITKNDIHSDEAGIYLYKSSLSIITDNLIYDNGATGGIHMEGMERSIIYNNTIYNNTGDGIHMISSTNRNTIQENTIWNNSNGIHLEISNSNIIYNNTIEECDGSAILIEDFSHSNTIRGNILTHNTYGMDIKNSSNNGIIGCSIAYNTYGIYLFSSSSNVMQLDNIYNNSNGGIIFASTSNNNAVYSCSITNCSRGIYIWSSLNNTIEENDITYNGDAALYLYYSASGFSGGNRIINNSIHDNNMGAYLISSDGNIIDKDTFYNNTAEHIKLSSSDENIITNNTIYNGLYGMYLTRASYNIIDNNTIHHVSEHAIALYSYSTENNIIENVIGDNKDGIHIESSNTNNILNNTLFENNENGIYVASSYLNIIENNTIYLNDNDGILLLSSDQQTITNNTIYNNTNGIHLISSGGSGNVITENEIYGNSFSGILLENSKASTAGNNEITGNEIYGNSESGIYLYSSNTNSIQQNEIYANEYGIFTNSSDDNTIESNAIYRNTNIGLYLISSNGNRINNNSISFNEIGMCFYASSQGDQYKIGGNMIWNNTMGIFLNASDSNYFGYDRVNIVWNNSYGIYMIGSSNNHFNYNLIRNNTYGFFITSSDNYFSSNIISNNSYGMYLYQASGIEISDNRIYNNTIGVYINNSSTYNIITENDFILNDPSQYGVYIGGVLCKDNRIYLNNFINVTSINRSLGYDNGGGNSWYYIDSIEKRGNYWGNYIYIYPNATMLPENNSWYWSIPYEIDGNAGEEDIHPLIAKD